MVGGFATLFASLVVVAVVLPWELTALRVGCDLLGFAYNWPVLPGRRRIKALYVHSALDLAERFAQRRGDRPGAGDRRARRATALLGAAIAFTDAALIEPIAVRVGLWRWFEPGLLGVPAIGILGWALFSGLAVATLRSRGHPGWVLLVAPPGEHLLLPESWRGLMRHRNGTIDSDRGPRRGRRRVGARDDAPAAVGGALASGGVRGPRPPGAAFFSTLLVLHALDDALLVAYAACFALPWLVTVWRSLRWA